MTSYTDEDWEELAKKWREAAGVDDQLRLNAPQFVRWLKQIGRVKDYICVPDAELSSDGKYEPDEGRLYFRTGVWERSLDGHRRDIWTLIHESSHAILRHTETRLRSAPSSRAYRSREVGLDETDTNRLTASILAPFHKSNFMLTTTAEDIQERFGISFPAATRRVEEFARLYRRRHGIPRPLPSGIIDFLHEQKRKGLYVPSLENIGPLIPKARKQYEGDPCPKCGEFSLARTGLSMKCDECGARTGDD